MSSSSSNVYSPKTDISFNIDTNDNIKKDVILFWGDNPNILLHNLTELFPTNEMTYNQSLNAISRLVILVALLSILVSGSFRFLFILFATLGAIWVLWYTQTKKNKKKVRFNNDDVNSNSVKESFLNPTTVLLSDKPPSLDTFQMPSTTNPFGNTLMTDYDYNPNKKPAAPSFNNKINDEILNKAKQTVIDLNPDQPDIADKLFHDLGEQYIFEQSMRPFYSNASTTIPNDQKSFAEFCYGSMVSCKEGNPFACARNLSRYTNV